jgi:D-xylose transport system permease protein
MSNHQTTDVDVAAAGDRNGIGQAVGDYFTRVRGGDVGSLPAVLGLIVLFLLFTILKPETFFSFFNFANLLNQSAAIIVLAMGLVFVLLLGEIDLSAGFTAGTSAAVLAVALSSWGLAWPIALIIGLLTGTLIGLFIGTLVARLGIPSFVVTLAMFLALQGVMLLIIGEGGTIRLRSDVLLAIMNQNMPLWAGWVMWAVVVLGYGVISWRAIGGRRKAGLKATATSVWIAKTLALAVMMGVLVFVLNQQRQILRPGKESCPLDGDAPIGCIPVIQGVPWAVLVVIVLVVGLTFVLGRTSFGRHVYAVGGNAEASRRAGINVKSIRIYCFMIGSRRGRAARLARQLRVADDGWCPDTALRRGCGRHRWHKPLRWQGQGDGRRDRWSRHRRHRQRPAADHPAVGHSVRRHRPGAAGGRQRRCHLAQTGERRIGTPLTWSRARHQRRTISGDSIERACSGACTREARRGDQTWSPSAD